VNRPVKDSQDKVRNTTPEFCVKSTAVYLTVTSGRGGSKLRWYHGLSRPLG